jgi:hypothetical protein
MMLREGLQESRCPPGSEEQQLINGIWLCLDESKSCVATSASRQFWASHRRVSTLLMKVDVCTRIWLILSSPRGLGDVACPICLCLARRRHRYRILGDNRWRHWNDVCVQLTGRDGFNVCASYHGNAEINTDAVYYQVSNSRRQVCMNGHAVDKYPNYNIGQYHWVSELAPPRIQKELSYAVGWLTAMGWQGMNIGTPDQTSH